MPPARRRSAAERSADVFEALRRQLEEEVARFLAQGGKVKEIPPDVQADPPQKPVSNYGSKPI